MRPFIPRPAAVRPGPTAPGIARRRAELFGPPSLALTLLVIIALILPGCGSQPRGKVFVLGMDGLTFELLWPWVEEGHLPNFARLLDEGSSTQLVSAIPPSSPPAWTSAITGVNPGKHGIFGFVQRIDHSTGEPRLVFYTAADRKADPVWTILTERGRRSVVVNVPCTSPPDSIAGVMISGFPHTSPTNFTSPPGYRLKIPDYRLDIFGQLVSVDGEQAFLEDMNDIMDRRAEAAFGLMEEQSWDLFFVVFTITDRIQHYFWKHMDPQHPLWDEAEAELYGDAILRTYQAMDRLLGQVRARLDDQTTLVVMSDHGFGPVYQPVNGQNFLDATIPEGDFGAVATDNFGVKMAFTVKRGTPVNPQTHRTGVETMELLKRKLLELEDPATGRKVVQKVFSREELYWGPYKNKAPHLMGLEEEGYLFWNWYQTPDGIVFPAWGDSVFNRLFSGFHKRNGVLIMTGTNIAAGRNSFPAHISDIAPTILYLLGEPIPAEMDGRVLEPPLTDTYLRDHPVEVSSRDARSGQLIEEAADTTAAVNRYIEEQLRAIGYVQ
jgi:predicted AlkP superfamily phosphohydrolase/phosphomutase